VSARRVVGFVGVVAGFMVATWIGGWWTVPVVALVAGFMRVRPGLIALAASVAWLVLLGADAVLGGEAFGKLVVLLSGVLRAPGLVAVMLTVVFPGVLGWSAGVVGQLGAGLLGRE
jgi:hypothetical protein